MYNQRTGSTYIRRFGRMNVGPDDEYILEIEETLPLE